jgi:hypothetical protein
MKGWFVVNLSTKSKHWSKLSVRMETLPEYALKLERGVLCVATDENSVIIMCRRIFCTFLAGKSNMTNPASSTIDARCGYFVWAMVGIRGVRPNPGGASNDRKLTGFGCFSLSDKVSDWIADRQAKGPTGIDSWGVY